MADDFVNPSYETAGVAIGDADSWVWTSQSQAEAWVSFNATAHAAYLRAVEGFEAGHGPAWDVSYADEAARLAAPVGPADVGLIARQESDRTLWVLVSGAPVLWAALSDANEGWMSTLPATTVIALFNSAASATWQGTIERFLLWASGPPWLEAATLLRQDDAQLVAMGPTYAGWKGWHDAAVGRADDPIGIDVFGEAWSNDPFGSGIHWIPGTAPGGVLRGDAIALPVTIPPNQNRLVAYHDLSGAVYPIAIPAGTYATATALAAAIQGVWAGAVATTGSRWAAWQQGAAQGITFGWDGVSYGSELILLGIEAGREAQDARGLIGLRALAPGGRYGAVQMPSHLLLSPPPAATVYHLDPWACVDYQIAWDLTLGRVPLEYGSLGAQFDGATTYGDLFVLGQWFPGATWDPGFDPGDLTAAAWGGGVGVGGEIESFEDPGTWWPDHLYQ